MSKAVTTTKARVLQCQIKGAELHPYCRKVTIRESICTSYISGEVVLYDNNDVVNGLQLVGGEEVNISFDAPVNPRIYKVKLRVLAIQGEPSPENLKTIIYTISLVGDGYFTDRENLVQDSPPVGTPGASLAQKIWKDCGFLSQLFTLIDAPIRDATEAFTIQNVKPFTAIAQIRNQMNYPQYPSAPAKPPCVTCSSGSSP